MQIQSENYAWMSVYLIRYKHMAGTLEKYQRNTWLFKHLNHPIVWKKSDQTKKQFVWMA